MNKFENLLYFLHPKRWVGIKSALNDQVPDFDKIMFNVLKSLIIDMILPITILSWASSITVPTERHQHSLATSSGDVNTMSMANHLHTYQLVPQLYGAPKNLLGIFLPSTLPIFINISTITILSPFVLSSLHHLRNQIMNTIVNRIRMWHMLRIQPDQEAVECQVECIARNTLVRNKHCDIYFPTIPKVQLSNHNSPANEEQQKVLLFIPGAFVDHASYAVIANRLTTRGRIVVAVLSMEPLRQALKGIGADVSDIVRVMKIVREELKKRNNSKIGDYKLIEWSLGGHSLGAYSAMRLSPMVLEHILTKSAINEPAQTKLKIVAWAAGKNLHYVTNLSSYNEHEMRVLVITGSNDRICDFSPENKSILHSFLSQLPPKYQYEVIKGGTHNNFASYSGPVKFNGVPGLPRDKQHQMIVDKTMHFLNMD